jgi:hypothetical protein
MDNMTIHKYFDRLPIEIFEYLLMFLRKDDQISLIETFPRFQSVNNRQEFYRQREAIVALKNFVDYILIHANEHFYIQFSCAYEITYIPESKKFRLTNYLTNWNRLLSYDEASSRIWNHIMIKNNSRICLTILTTNRFIEHKYIYKYNLIRLDDYDPDKSYTLIVNDWINNYNSAFENNLSKFICNLRYIWSSVIGFRPIQIFKR